ncbi:MAG: oligosaccharide flippase family protein [Beijerinckiaceae bacterium]|nr:oligosaccharide flippase family protein [Beijerinckiaceae bacterium]
MASHALIYLIAFALPGVIGLFSFSIYTRVLTPEEYAVYTVGASVSFLIGNVCYGWLRFALSRYQSEAPDTNFLPFVMRCFAGVTVILLPVAAIITVSVFHLSAVIVGAILFMTVAQALFDITQETRRARHQSGAFARSSVSRSLISFSLAVFGASVFHAGSALLYGIGSGFMLFALLYLWQQRHLLRRDSVGLETVRRFTIYGLPLALSGLVFSGNSTVSRLIVSSMVGAAAAGHFGAALDVTNQICGIIAASIASILGPTAIKAYKTDGKVEARRKLADGAELFLGAMVPTTIGLVLVSDSFSDVIVGNAFEGPVREMLPVLAVSRGLNVFAQFYLHLGFQIVEQPVRQVVCGATTLIVNALASVILIAMFGLMGAVYALLIGDIVGVLVSIILLRPVFPMPIPLRLIVRVCFCALVMAAACLAVEHVLRFDPRLSLLGTTLVGGLVYCLCAYWLDIARLRTQLWGAGLRKLGFSRS